MKKIFFISLLITTAISFAQDDYELIILDGKQVYMSTSTGEIFNTRPKTNRRTKKNAAANALMASYGSSNDVHVVSKGETLFSISRMYGVSISKICSQNEINKSDVLKIGQQLTINKNSSNQEDYIVEKGDTLYAISKKLGVSVQRLKELNGLNSNIIKIGQSLITY